MISEHFLNLKNARVQTLRKASRSLSSFHPENITADKREIEDKLPSATSFIRKTLKGALFIQTL